MEGVGGGGWGGGGGGGGYLVVVECLYVFMVVYCLGMQEISRVIWNVEDLAGIQGAMPARAVTYQCWLWSLRGKGTCQ